VHAGLEQRRAVLALLLGAVHRGVGVAQDHRAVLGAGGLGDADARVHHGLPALQDDGTLQRRQDPLGHLRAGQGAATAREQDGELVAAQPRGEVVLAHAGGDPLGDLDEQLVTGAVPEAVVDRLEVVQVEHQDGRGRPAAVGDGLVDAADQQRAVGQSGERVVRGVMAQPLLELAELVQ